MKSGNWPSPYLRGRRSGIMVSALVSGLSGAVASPGGPGAVASPFSQSNDDLSI